MKEQTETEMGIEFHPSLEAEPKSIAGTGPSKIKTYFITHLCLLPHVAAATCPPVNGRAPLIEHDCVCNIFLKSFSPKDRVLVITITVLCIMLFLCLSPLSFSIFRRLFPSKQTCFKSICHIAPGHACARTHAGSNAQT